MRSPGGVGRRPWATTSRGPRCGARRSGERRSRSPDRRDRLDLDQRVLLEQVRGPRRAPSPGSAARPARAMRRRDPSRSRRTRACPSRTTVRLARCAGSPPAASTTARTFARAWRNCGGEVALADEHLVRVPRDLSGDEYEARAGGRDDAVRVAARAAPSPPAGRPRGSSRDLALRVRVARRARGAAVELEHRAVLVAAQELHDGGGDLLHRPRACRRGSSAGRTRARATPPCASSSPGARPTPRAAASRRSAGTRGSTCTPVPSSSSATASE